MASIFSKLFGNKEIDNILSNIDATTQKYFKHTIEAQSYDTLSKNAINDAIKLYDEDKSKDKDKKAKNQLELILSEIEVPAERLNRYDVYDHLYKSVQLIKRIITVYINNIFQKDTINNEILIVSERESLSTSSESKLMKFYVRQIIKYFKLDKKIKYHTGFNVLKYGDSFVELIDYTKIDIPFPKINKEDLRSEQKLLQEITNSKNSKNEYKQSNADINVFVSSIIPILCEFNNAIYMTDKDTSVPIFEDAPADSSDYDFFNRKKLQSIILRFHKPHKIIPLISPFESILGFVELSTVDRNSNNSSSNYFKEIVNQFNNCGSNNKTNVTNKQVIEKFGKEIVKTILIKNNVSSKENQSMTDYVDDIHSKIGDDLFNSLQFILLSPENLFKSKLKVRFIKVEDMFWFKTPSSDYYPFGRSIIDPLVFPGKMYLFNQLANNITKLSKAASIRKWTVNISAVLKFC